MLVIMANLHVIKDNGFDMSQDNSQIMTQKLNRLDFSLPASCMNNGFGEHFFFPHVVNHNAVGEVFVKDCN